MVLRDLFSFRYIGSFCFVEFSFLNLRWIEKNLIYKKVREYGKEFRIKILNDFRRVFRNIVCINVFVKEGNVFV